MMGVVSRLERVVGMLDYGLLVGLLVLIEYGSLMMLMVCPTLLGIGIDSRGTVRE